MKSAPFDAPVVITSSERGAFPSRRSRALRDVRSVRLSSECQLFQTLPLPIATSAIVAANNTHVIVKILPRQFISLAQYRTFPSSCTHISAICLHGRPHQETFLQQRISAQTTRNIDIDHLRVIEEYIARHRPSYHHHIRHAHRKHV